MKRDVRLPLRNHDLVVLVVFEVSAGDGICLVVLPVVDVNLYIVQRHSSAGFKADGMRRVQREQLSAFYCFRKHKALRGLFDLDSQARRQGPAQHGEAASVRRQSTQ